MADRKAIEKAAKVAYDLDLGLSKEGAAIVAEKLADSFAAALSSPSSVVEPEVVATLRRIAAGETKTARGRGDDCEVIFGSRPDGHTCLDEQAAAEDPNERYSDDFRAQILKPDYPCFRCQARKALASTPPNQSESTVNSSGVVAAAIDACRRIERASGQRTGGEGEGTLQVARRNLARGEVNVAEYLRELLEEDQSSSGVGEELRELLLSDEARRANCRAAAEIIKSAATFQSEEQWAIYEATVKAALNQQPSTPSEQGDQR